MEPSHDPDPDIDDIDLDGFQLPDGDAPREEWVRAFAMMNAIPMTIAEIERGYSSSCLDGRGPDIRALRAWCVAQGIEPADVAAEAILLRVESVLEAAFAGIDVSESPDGQPSLIELALSPLDLDDYLIRHIG